MSTKRPMVSEDNWRKINAIRLNKELVSFDDVLSDFLGDIEIKEDVPEPESWEDNNAYPITCKALNAYVPHKSKRLRGYDYSEYDKHLTEDERKKLGL